MRFFNLTRLATLLSAWAAAQTPQPAIVIDSDNVQFYARDLADFGRLATVTTPTQQTPARNFNSWEGVGDIVAINGAPAKGVWRATLAGLTTSLVPANGSAIADTARGNSVLIIFEILDSSGTPIGTILGYGLNAGAAPPGAPAGQSGSNLAITGGTGAYLGVRGQIGFAAGRIAPVPYRGNASMSEDPGLRRAIGAGQTRRDIVHLIDTAFRPEVVVTTTGPAIVHASDFSPVTASKPARAGELLSLYARGLGPTKTPMNPGQPFPSSPLAVVNSPVDVLVGGVRSEVLYAGGYPDTTDGYQINFRLPSDVRSGSVSLQLVMGYIPGPVVMLPIE